MKQAFSLSLGVLALASSLGGCAENKTNPVVPDSHAQTANVMVCAPGSFTDGNECIPVAVPQCPFGTTLQEGQCVPSPGVAVEEPKPVAVAQPAALGGEYEALLDTRRERQSPRSRQLLITEVQGLEALFQSVPKGAADRPLLMRRLAQAYVELGAAAARDRAQARDADVAAKSEKIERAARVTAVKYYQMFFDQYPSFCQSKSASAAAASTGCVDEQLYYLGLEYLRGGQMDYARKTFLKLIQAWPASDKIAPAYFLFGEMFRGEAASDPTKWALAEQSFAQTAKYPGALQAPALLRLAEAYEAQGKTAEAADARKKASAAQVAAPATGTVP